jgi:fibronectin type 3 domain-containing protein
MTMVDFKVVHLQKGLAAAATVLLLSMLSAACTEDSMQQTFDGASSDPSRAGVFEAIRRPNGTVAVTLRGIKGAQQYEVYEVEATSPDGSDGTETRVLRTVIHTPGKLDYQIETNDIPFGKNFCYRARVKAADQGDATALRMGACLQDNNSWSFDGIKQVRADQTGSIIINWTRVPTEGVTYKIFRRFADTEAEFKPDPTVEVYDSSEHRDEVRENVFPRCYAIKAYHSLFSRADANTKEFCLDKTTYAAQVQATPDAIAPDFTGIESIAVTEESSSLLDTALTAMGINSSLKVRLTWSRASDNLSPAHRIRYRIYRSEKLTIDESSFYGETDPGVLFFIDDKVPDRKRVHYLVRAVDDHGNMDGNFKWREIPLDFDPPQFAGVANAKPERKDGNVNIRVTWVNASDNKTPAAAIEYLVYRSTVAGEMDFAEPLATVRGQNFYIDTAVSRGAKYYYSVRARDEGGNVDRNQVVLEAQATGSGPQFDGLTQVTRVGRNAVLSWNQASDDDTAPNEIAYAVYRSTSEDDFKMTEPIFRTPVNATTANDPTASIGVTYFYRVRAVDKNGFEDENVETKTLAANRAPTWPLNTRPNAAGPEWKNLNNGKLVWEHTEAGALLQWSPASDDYTTSSGLTYYVYKSDRSNLFNTTNHIAKVTQTAGSDLLRFVDKSDHQFGQAYYYMIRAEDEFGARSVNSSVVELPANSKPSMPVITGALLDKTTQRVTIQWNVGADDRTAPGALMYRLYRYERNQTNTYAVLPANLLANLDGTKTSYIDASPRDPVKDYVWILQVVDGSNLESDPSDPRGLGDNTPPSAGGIISAIRSTSQMVTIAWSPSEDAQEASLSYRVYAKEVPLATPSGSTTDGGLLADLFTQANERQTVTGNTGVLTFGNFARNKAFVFGVRAYDSKGLFDANMKGAVVAGNPAPTFAGISIGEFVVQTGRARLTWLPGSDDSPSNLLDYRIYKLENTQPTATAEQVLSQGVLYSTSGAGSTVYEDSGIRSSVHTHYLVRCIDPDGSEDTNTVVRSIPPDTTRPVFLGIKNVTMNGRRITLTWDPASDNRTHPSQIKYQIYESTSNVVADLLATTPIAEVVGVPTFNGLDGSGQGHMPPSILTHYYLVRVVDEAGNTDTNGIVRQTIDEIPPDFAGLINGFPITNRSAQLFWTGVPNDDIYQVQIFRSDNTSTPIASVNARTSSGAWVNSYLVTGLTPATSYSYIARAVDGAGNTETNTVTINLTTLAGEAPVFAGLQAAEPALGVDGMSKVNLRWSAADNATHFRIFRVQGPSSIGTEFGNFNYDTCSANWNSPTLPGCVEVEAGIGDHEYTVTNLTKNTEYSFIVRAVILANGNLIGEEQNRVIRTVRTLDEVAPTLAGAKTVTPASGDAGLSSLVVRWDLPNRNGVWDGFRVLYKDFSGAPLSSSAFTVPENLLSDPGIVAFDVNDLAAQEATIGNLITGRRYCFTVVTRYQPLLWVRSVPANPAGYVCATPTAQPPEFAGVKASVEKGLAAQAFKQFTVSWDPALGSFTRYEVSWSKINNYTSPTNTGSFFTVPANQAVITNRATSSYTITNLDPNETYYVRVRAIFERVESSIYLQSGAQVVTQNMTTPIIPNGDGVLSVKQISDDEVEVKWDPPNNNGLFNTYHIFLATGSGADSDVVAQTSQDFSKTPPYSSAPLVSIPSSSSVFSARSWVHTGVLPDTRYCYLIKASYVGSEGFVTSPNIKVQCADVQIAPPTFNGISSLAAPNAATGFTSLVARWEKASGNFSKYQISITTGADDEPVWTDINGAITTESHTIPNLLPNTQYYVRIRAVYLKASLPQVFESGGANQLSAVTTPLAPQHAGLQPIEFLESPGEVKIKWDLPNANPDIGGVYDRFFIWRFTDGLPSDIMAEIDNLMNDPMTPGLISAAEVASVSNHVSEVLSTSQTELEYRGVNKLTENKQTCFLVRAAFRAGDTSPRFLMSGNQTIRCVTPTASAPQFSGMATLENIPLSVNGFNSIKATWVPAQGVFTRYEIALSTSAGSNTWTPLASSSTVKSEDFRLLYNMNASGAAETALQNFSHQTLYGRMRALYVGGDNTVYSAGESTELAVTVRPDRPLADGLRSAAATKVPGQVASTSLVFRGDASGFWDKYFVWREVHDDQATAYNAVVAKAKANTQGTNFVSPPNFNVSRPQSSSTNDLTHLDNGVAVGKFNCYIARAGYSLSPNFLLSDTPQTPVCVRPDYNPISFSGVAPAGSEVCTYDDPQNALPCSASTRWPNTGNSMVRLKLASVPAGDIDFYDVYRGSSPDPVQLLAQAPFQIIPKGDAVHDPNPDDVYLHVGGLATQYVPPGRSYYLVRARCLGCVFNDTNTSVTNPVEALAPWLASSFDMKVRSGSSIWTQNAAGYGVFEDEGNQGVLSSSGFADLLGDNDYLKSTNPVLFVPRPNTTFGIKFTLNPRGTTLQNVEGSAVFAADVGNRQPMWRTVSGANVLAEGALLGAPGASTVYDKRNNTCLFIGGYAGQGIDFGDWPSRDWRSHWQTANLYYALRFQTWDGQNLGEVRTRGGSNDSPLPRSMPVLAHNPITGNVMLFGGFNQGSTQRLMADTWEWDGQRWMKLADGPLTNQMVAGELGRYGHGVLSHDPFRNEMMMVGGRYKVGDNNAQDWNMARTQTTGQGGMGWLEVLRDARNDKMWHFRPDAQGKLNWQVTANLPAAFPLGYPAQLVTVPSGPGAGVYYFSARWDSWESSNNNESNNVWKYDGNNWVEIPNSRWMSNGGLRPMANLYGAWDATKQRIILTFGRGNDFTGRVIWEYNPDPAVAGPSAWTVRALANSPFTTLGGTPCFHEATRDLVFTGGIPDWGANQQVTKRSQIPQDVHVFNTGSNQWRRHELAYDPSSAGMMATHEGLRGVFQVGSGQWHTLLGWSEVTTAYLPLLFKNGFWRELAVDNLRKLRWGGQHAVNHNVDQRLSSRSSAPGAGDVFAIVKSNHQQITTANATQAITAYGQPDSVVRFDGSGWTSTPVTATNLKFHDRFCPNPLVTSQANHTHSYPQFRLPWFGVDTSRGVLASSFDVEALWPYEFFPTTTPNCSATQTWRYSYSPFILVTESAGQATVAEIKEYGSPEWAPADPNKFCAPPSATVASHLRGRQVYKQHDAATGLTWLFGIRDFDWSRFYRDIQAISFNAASNCYQVQNFSAPFPNASWTQISAYNDRMDYWGYDASRNVITLISKHGMTSTIANGSTNGVIWELDLNTIQWRQRLLPDEFRRWSTMQGSHHTRMAPIPGRNGEYYVAATRERHSWRAMHEAYILRIDANTVSLRPILPRFGLTLGAADGSGTGGTAGFLSVPGDLGDTERVYAGETLFQGRRKIADDLLGENDLYVVFGTSTYRVFLNGNAVSGLVNGVSTTEFPWDGSSGLYMMDFLLGARYGSFYRHDDDSQSGFKGIGNTNISVDWVRSFGKQLSQSERYFWTDRDDNEVAP